MVRDDSAMASSDDDEKSVAERVWAAFEAHGSDVYRYVHRRCGDASMAEEITQDVFVACLESDRPAEPVPIEWLYRVARNQLIDVIRRQRNYETKLRLVAGTANSIDSEFEEVDRLRMERVLAGLSSLHRSVLMLRYVDGLPVRELAGLFDRSERGVEALLVRARAAMRREFEATDG